MSGLKIQENVSLAPMTTFKIGGPAKFFAEVKSKEDLEEAIEWRKSNNELIFVLGGGSNVLVNDKGVDGLVVKLSNNGLKVKGERLEAGSGVLLSKAMIMANGNSLSGLEWAIGIPGSVGGAVRGNAGANGFSISDFIETVEAYNMKKKSFVNFSRKECMFNYRESVFKYDKNLIIWSATFKLESFSSDEIKKRVARYLKNRENSQPRLPSAGSVFKNIDLLKLKSDNANLANKAEEEKVVKNGKVPAGWIIDQHGLKGKTMGGAKVSLQHANFIVNTGKATAEDVIMLISFIKQQIRVRFGVQLYEEVQYLGI